MPRLAVLPAAAQAGLGVHPAHLHPHHVRRRKLRHQRDVEAAIRIQQRRRRAVEDQPFFVADKHRHPRAVLAGREDLLRLVQRRIEQQLRLPVDRGLAGFHVQPVGRARRRKVAELIKGLRVLAPAAEAIRRADCGQGKPFDQAAIKPPQLHQALRVRQIAHDECVIDDRNIAQLVRALRNHRFPVLALRLVQVDRNHPAVRRVERRQHPEERAIVVDRRIGRVRRIDQPQNGRIRIFEILHRKLIVRAGAFALVQHQVAAIVGHVRAEVQLLIIGPVEDQLVFALRRAQFVKHHFVKVVGGFEGLTLGRIVPLVEEAAAILQPRRPAELRPLHHIRQILARRDIAHVPLQPVAACIRDRIRGQQAIIGNADAADRNRPVLRERVRVEKHLRLAIEPLLPVKNVLVLQPAVVRVEVPRAAPRRRRVPLEIDQLHQPPLDPLSPRNLRQIPLRQLILRIDPHLQLGGVHILHPAVRIADRSAEVVIRLIDLPRGRIAKL